MKNATKQRKHMYFNVILTFINCGEYRDWETTMMKIGRAHV